jgi:hypothetical protein
MKPMQGNQREKQQYLKLSTMAYSDELGLGGLMGHEDDYDRDSKTQYSYVMNDKGETVAGMRMIIINQDENEAIKLPLEHNEFTIQKYFPEIYQKGNNFCEFSKIVVKRGYRNGKLSEVLILEQLNNLSKRFNNSYLFYVCFEKQNRLFNILFHKLGFTAEDFIVKSMQVPERKIYAGQQAFLTCLKVKQNKVNSIVKSFIFALFFTMLLFSNNDYASATIPEEEALKEAFIYKFIKFIDNDWIRDKRKIDVCIFTDKYDKTTKKQSYIRKLPVVVNYNIAINKISNCEVLYLQNNHKTNYRKIIKNSIDKNILTISDRKYFLDQGGVIEFYRHRNKIRFKINNSKAMQMGIIFNAKLLELSKTE